MRVGVYGPVLLLKQSGQHISQLYSFFLLKFMLHSVGFELEMQTDMDSTVLEADCR